MMLRRQWCETPEFSEWLRPVKDNPSLGFCMACKSQIKLRTGGKGAIKSHSMSEKHRYKLELYRFSSSQNGPPPNSCTDDVSREVLSPGEDPTPVSKSPALQSFPTASPESESDSTDKNCSSANEGLHRNSPQHELNEDSSEKYSDSAGKSPGSPIESECGFNQDNNGSEVMNLEDESNTQFTSEICLSSTQFVTSEIKNFLNRTGMNFKCTKDCDINRILDFVSWILIDNFRITDCLNSTKLLPIQTKIANFFKWLLMVNLESDVDCVLLLNERFCKTSSCKQIDVHVRYFNEIQNKVETRYFTSEFVQPNDTFDIESLDSLEADVIQQCLSGYSLKIPEKRKTGGKILTFTSLVLCIQDAFKHGETQSEMKVGEFLRNLENFFDDSPGTTAEFIKTSKCKLIPLPYTRHGLQKNIEAATRAIEIWNDVKDFIDHYTVQSHSESYLFLKKACHDVTTEVQLNFYISVAEMTQSLVDYCESDKPFLPLLADKLLDFVRDCLGNFSILKKEHIPKTPDSLGNLNLEDFSFYCHASEVCIGVTGEEMLKDIVNENLITFRQLINFKTQAQYWILNMVKKLIDETIKKKPIILTLSCLNPSHMIKDRKDCVSKMRTLLCEFSKTKSPKDLDESLRLFGKFLDDILDRDDKEFNGFNQMDVEDRLDTVLHARMGNLKYSKLWDFVKKILILHNGQVSAEKMYEGPIGDLSEQYVHRRHILDHVRCVWGAKDEKEVIMEITQIVRLCADDSEIHHKNISPKKQRKYNEL